MSRVVISTIGTSLLTNQINRNTENNWYSRLRDTANITFKEIADQHPDVTEIIQVLQTRGKAKIDTDDINLIRSASAELNGIYGLYKGRLETGKEQRDIHWLITTDTYQGITTAQIVKNFLQKRGIIVDIYAPRQLSTASSESFSNGIDDLISWLDNNIYPYKQSHYQICFNLVGSFKSLQGYLNTIGMFYADEIIYIFEGKNSELITIPRLPISIDYTAIAPYKLQLALMDAGAVMNAEIVRGIHESMIYPPGKSELTLSTWGQLVWNQCKKEMLSQELLPFERLQYRPSFVADYKNIRSQDEKVKLQETLAKVSYLLNQSNGDTSVLKKDGGLQYDKYTNKGNIEHFRVTQGLRISCVAISGMLELRRYGAEPVVNNNP
ncbi:CRISPR-associated protein, APE2256 family [Crinalium epipsammum PCC 9333]|uniref:CRISPR-associated protein, APE2256 family n=1 Tax=Crinalium epipsammum PCC 9333 TaxID=1173022 RepID=K9VWM3_9CYAN|nr:CRISPR-associated protein [Crinalium epipsammum]AFZ11530.1 CRISPR-associated protein, APE2256 family [Crinalium epipsammum PCC 9333]